MSIRLLYLTAETYPTYRVDLLVLFGKILPKYGIHSDIVAGKTEGNVETASWGGGETYLCDVSGGSARIHINTFLHGIRHMLKADRKRYQAIQVRDMPLLAAIGLLVARFKGLKFFYWMSFPISEGLIVLARERGLSSGLIKFLFPWVKGQIGYFLLYRLVLPRADHVFVQSDQMKEALVKRGFHPGRMTPVPMGVDMETLQSINIPPVDDVRLVNRRVLVYLGTLDRPRRIEILFEMIAIVKRQFSDVLLILVGDANEETHRCWLKMKASEAGIEDNLLWTGWLPMYEGWRYVRTAAVGLSPIPRGYLLDVSSPTKVLEYLALGIPVVCNDNPDQERVIRESEAGICVLYSAEDFANAVIRMLCLDKNARDEMGIRGKEYVAHHRDYRLIGDNVANSYRNLFSDG
ncbi:glycosyltransferase [Nitrosomonas sp.]|uniref:glycosyltransferase n=1 Tax=Nitrosomonas sp. TaxID=42353 RepID=UPI0032EF2247